MLRAGNEDSGIARKLPCNRLPISGPRPSTLLGSAGVNIATFNLGRDRPGGDAITLVSVDEAISADLLKQIEAIAQVKRARKLSFSR